MEHALAVITIATFVKDLIELGSKIKDSIDRVGENKKELSKLRDEVTGTLDGLTTLTQGFNNAQPSLELLTALEDLKNHLESVHSKCQRASQHSSWFKSWWNCNKIDREIKRLHDLKKDCHDQFALFSTARTEGKVDRIADTTTRIESAAVQLADTTARIEGSTAQFTGVIARIEDSTSRIDQGTAQVTATATRIETGTVEVACTTARIEDSTSRIEHAANEVEVMALRQKLERWLEHPPNMKKRQDDTQELQHEGTGGWFSGGRQYKGWKEKPGSLWIRGDSGTGKSVLSSTVIRQLFSQRQHGTAIAYFYFDFRDEKSQRVKIMLQSIILQLSAQSPKSHSALEREYKYSQGQTLPTYDKLLGILEELLLDVAHTYIVLDALDECNEHGLLVQFITRFRDWTTRSLHLLFASQPRQIFMEAFKHASLVTLTIHNMQSDIQRFISSKLHQLSHLTCRMHPEDITAKVLKKSNGMFRLAALLLIELRDAFNPDLDTILSSFPDSLFGVYSRFLQRIHPTAVFYVSTILRWLAFSSSPVTMDILEDALAFDFSNPSEFVYDPTRRGENAARVCKMLEGMIVVNQIWWDNTRAVSFAHASVEDYLRSEKFTQEYTAYDLRAEPSYRFLAQSCLGFLQFISRPLPPAPFSLVRQKYPLGSYAAANWSYHLHRSDDPALLLSLAVRFLQSENGLKRYYPTGVMQLPNVQPLSVCSQFVRFLLQNGADPNMSDNGFTALQAASSHGNLDIVHILLRSGAKVLCAASLHGHLNIVRILLQSGAKVDVVVLEKACIHGRWDQVLLDDLVITASKRGRSDMVRLLLEYGADVNAATKKYNALGAASFHGHVEAIRVLLEKGAEVNATSGIYGSALQIASYQGDTEIVRLLIEHGAKVNAAGGEYGSALQAASREGNTETCRLLLENGAEVNAAGGRFGSALQAASIRGRVESVQCLLQYGADVNAAGGVYGNALQAACANGCVAVVRLLLEKGADVNAFGGSALKAAIRRGRLHPNNWRQAEQITLILLENGAHPGITDYDSEEDVDTDDEGAMSDSSSNDGSSSESDD